jgi:hypothetical protein
MVWMEIATAFSTNRWTHAPSLGVDLVAAPVRSTQNQRRRRRRPQSRILTPWGMWPVVHPRSCQNLQGVLLAVLVVEVAQVAEVL